MRGEIPPPGLPNHFYNFTYHLPVPLFVLERVPKFVDVWGAKICGHLYSSVRALDLPFFSPPPPPPGQPRPHPPDKRMIFICIYDCLGS